jgi:hypothetical protein
VPQHPAPFTRPGQTEPPTPGPESPRRPDTAPEAARGEQAELPVRARGAAYAAVRSGNAADLDHPGDATDPRERPALPQRREHPPQLRPELRSNPVLTRPIPGHSPNLLADLQLGRVAGQQEIAQEEAKPAPANDTGEQPQRTNERNTEGEKGSWPTI